LYDEKLCDKEKDTQLLLFNFYEVLNSITKLGDEGEILISVDIQPKNAKRQLLSNEKFQKASLKSSKLAEFLTNSYNILMKKEWLNRKK